MMKEKWSFDTKVIHGGQTPDDWQGATISPIYQTASHGYETAEQLSDVFTGKSEGFVYQRLTNPTNQALERRLTLLEGGIAAIVTASGMAAVNNSVLAICGAGDEIVCANSLFMSTYQLFNKVLKKLAIKVKMVETTDIDAWKAAVTKKTKLLYVETIGNPKIDVPDIKRLAELAHENDAPLIVDNTVASPYLFRPIEHGADIVVHSTTKFLNGHGTAVGGAIIDKGSFSWPEEKYPDFLQYKEQKGELAYKSKVWKEIHINFGTCQAPFHSYLTLIGLDTLALRMDRHLSNAIRLAEFFVRHPKVTWVNFPGIPESRSHSVAVDQFQGKGFGSLFTIGLKNEKNCFELIRNLKLAGNLANLGDCKTLIIHPWSSQYAGVPANERLANGVSEDLIRISVGIEGIDDILTDFDQALAKI
jgi:O-acetylhomoserine (thiol)-lyase